MEIEEGRTERGKGKKSSKEEEAVMSSVGSTWAHKPSFPSPTRDGKESDPVPFLYSPPSPPPFSFILSVTGLSSTKLSSSS
jgi:hypothetical protein